jgi:endo-1,4-beta-xylanase
MHSTVHGLRDSFYCDTADGQIPVESVIIQDWIPHLDRYYRTLEHRNQRILEGFSMGGFGAAHLGFKYPEIFGAVSILDRALLDADQMKARHRVLWERLFAGDYQRFQAEDPWMLAAHHASRLREETLIRIAVGALVAYNRRLSDQLKSLGIEHTYRELHVGHSQQAVYQALGEDNWEFYRRALLDRP